MGSASSARYITLLSHLDLRSSYFLAKLIPTVCVCNCFVCVLGLHWAISNTISRDINSLFYDLLPNYSLQGSGVFALLYFDYTH